jgi:DNA replication protein DnaC
MGFQAGTVTKAFLMELEKVPLQVLDDLGTAQKPEQF